MLKSWTINETRVAGKYCDQSFSGVIVGEISGHAVTLRIKLDTPLTVYGAERQTILMDCVDPDLYRA